MMHSQLSALLLVTLAFVLSCAPTPRDPGPADVAATQQEITRAMERHMVAARAVDPDAIASFFAPTAVLLEPGMTPVHTRDSIRAFMASFPGVRVDVATATPDTIEVFGDTALLWGSYFERLALPGQPVSELVLERVEM